MTIAEIVWDVKEIKLALEDDTDLEEMWLLHKVNSYRAVQIQQEYALTGTINPQWLQRVRRFQFTKVNSADDPAILLTSISLSRATLPRVISLPDDLGTYRVSGSSGMLQLDPVEFNTLMMKIDIGEEMNTGYGYYAKIGETIYAYPLMMEGSAIIIAEDPFDIPVLENGVLRTMTIEDDYPLDIAMAQRIVLEILTKDLALNDKAVADVINDSQHQFKVLRSGNNNEQNNS